MIRLNVHEAKTHLSRYLDRVLKGETIILCKRNHPVAEIRGLTTPRKTKRPVGLASGQLKVPTAFLEPLPDELLKAFEGHGP